MYEFSLAVTEKVTVVFLARDGGENLFDGLRKLDDFMSLLSEG